MISALLIFLFSISTAHADERKISRRCVLGFASLVLGVAGVTALALRPNGASNEKVAPEERYFKAQFSALRPVGQTLDSVLTSSPQVVMIGEQHGRNGEEVYPKLLAELKKRMPKLKYLAVEAASEREPAFDAFNRDGTPIPEDYRNSVVTQETLNAAKELGLSVAAVDGPLQLGWESTPDFPFTPERKARALRSFNLRNATMAQNIQSLVSKGDQVVFIVGAAHLQRSIYLAGEESRRSVSTLLSSSHVPNVSLRLIRTKDLETNQREIVKGILNPGGFIPHTPSAILEGGREMNEEDLSSGLMSRDIHWHDFDAILFFP